MNIGKAKYKAKDKVWLRPFEGNPRERCVITKVTKMPWGWSYVGCVGSNDLLADYGIREFPEDQIQGYAI